MTDTLQLWSERIRAAAATGHALQLRGGGTKAFYGNEPAGELLDTRDHSGIVSYEPSELVLTARCGTALSEIESTLAANGQMLAFEPPHFGTSATLGGCISAGLAGPRRVAAGAVRDFVLGIEMLDGRGDLQSFGGQVMKNVAGYDVSRLVCGALGTLGLITRVSIKVLPRPVAELSLQFEMSAAQALDALAEWCQLPLPLSASAVTSHRLRLRLSGARSAVEAARRQLGGEALPPSEADEYWLQLREHTHEFFSSKNASGPLWRFSVPPTAPALNLSEPQLIEWHGAQRWLRSEGKPAQLRTAATAVGGHATVFSGNTRESDVFAAVMPVLMQLQRQLKHSFDPQGVFNRGRLYSSF